MLEFSTVVLVIVWINRVRRRRRERSYVPTLKEEYFCKSMKYLERKGFFAAREEEEKRMWLELRNGQKMKLYSKCASFDDDKLSVTSDPHLKGEDLAETFKNVFEKNKTRPCLGAETSSREFHWFTYDDIYKRAQAIGVGLESICVRASNTTVGIYGKNSVSQ